VRRVNLEQAFIALVQKGLARERNVVRALYKDALRAGDRQPRLPDPRRAAALCSCCRLF
jgi:hypothetical protein